MSKRRSGLSNDRRRYNCHCKTQIIEILNGQGSIYSENLTEVLIPGSYMKQLHLILIH
jgi:hypothetical protein